MSIYTCNECKDAAYQRLKVDYDKLLKVEKELSDAYLRIRTLLGAWYTKPGGVDRFEVTEKLLRELLEKNN